jgi:hypothetical protein
MKKIREQFSEPGNPFPSNISDKLFNDLIRWEFVKEAGYDDHRRAKPYKFTKRLGKKECWRPALGNER